MEKARQDFREARLAQALRGQLEHWQLSKQLDSYLAELEMSIPAMGTAQEQAAAAEWLIWARQYQHRIDPLSRPLSTPRLPKPSPEDLKPFLHGWNPYQP